MTQRLGRIVRIIVMLQAGVRCNALRIAAEAGVHRRTVFRDFAALRSLGFPIAFDAATGCYHLPRGSMPQSDKGLAEFLSLFQDDAGGILADSSHEAVSPMHGDRSDPDSELLWQDLFASEKLFPEILATLIAAVQSQHRVMVVRSCGAIQERQLFLRVSEVKFTEQGWTISGVGDSGESIQISMDAIAECIEPEGIDDPSYPRHD
jgi:hypothetical protein